MTGKKELSRTQASGAKTLHAALGVLIKNDGHMYWKDITSALRQSLSFTPWELEPKTNEMWERWKGILSFYSIDAKKAGYILKSNGEWYITPEGEKAYKTMSPEELILDVSSKYKEWKKLNPKVEITEGLNNKETVIDETNSNESYEQVSNLEQLEEQARSQLEDFIRTKNPYEFQDIVAALLRGMGYFTPFIAPKGKDNGVDIIAYKDPIGVEKPTIKVQVKHHPDSSIQSQDVQKLKGTLSHSDEIGIFVTSGHFSPSSIKEARASNIHIETIDLSRLIELWKQFYSKLTDEDKNLMPLHPIYFLGSNE